MGTQRFETGDRRTGQQRSLDDACKTLGVDLAKYRQTAQAVDRFFNLANGAYHEMTAAITAEDLAGSSSTVRHINKAILSGDVISLAFLAEQKIFHRPVNTFILNTMPPHIANMDITAAITHPDSLTTEESFWLRYGTRYRHKSKSREAAVKSLLDKDVIDLLSGPPLADVASEDMGANLALIIEMRKELKGAIPKPIREPVESEEYRDAFAKASSAMFAHIMTLKLERVESTAITETEQQRGQTDVLRFMEMVTEEMKQPIFRRRVAEVAHQKL